ncbi:MAG TPA: 3-isopropylmalate dehydrogenase [Ferruginibacter sp.]|nr:3-isopropylmalate dehydrogenase [Ferruginibacter sp.]
MPENIKINRTKFPLTPLLELPASHGRGKGSLAIAVIPGDGIGPEVTRQALKVLNAVAGKFNHQFNFTQCLMGAIAIDQTGEPLPNETIEVCLESDAILFGAIGDPKYDNDPSAKVRPEQGLLKLRKTLQLFANIRPVKTYPSLHHLSPLKNKQLEGVDLIIYRELTGGIYFGKKTLSEDMSEASDLCIYNKSEIDRIARLAFNSAQSRRNKLTLVDKANVLETSRLWRKTVQEIAKDYPGVTVDYMFVDNAAMQLILNPGQFDIILTENMFGDILSDEASVITGSIGLLPSASVGNKTALFEPIHGSYPQAAGQDIANPIGSILSVAMMLDYFDLKEEAGLVREAVEWTINNEILTRDLYTVNFYFTSTIGDMMVDYINGAIPVTNKNNIELRKSTII